LAYIIDFLRELNMGRKLREAFASNQQAADALDRAVKEMLKR